MATRSPFSTPETEQPVGETAHLGVEIPIGQAAAVTWLTDPVIGHLMTVLFEMTVEAIEGDVELAVGEPLEERRIRVVEDLGGLFLPGDSLQGLVMPEGEIVSLQPPRGSRAERLRWRQARHGSNLRSSVSRFSRAWDIDSHSSSSIAAETTSGRRAPPGEKPDEGGGDHDDVTGAGVDGASRRCHDSGEDLHGPQPGAVRNELTSISDEHGLAGDRGVDHRSAQLGCPHPGHPDELVRSRGGPIRPLVGRHHDQIRPVPGVLPGISGKPSFEGDHGAHLDPISQVEHYGAITRDLVPRNLFELRDPIEDRPPRYVLPKRHRALLLENCSDDLAFRVENDVGIDPVRLAHRPITPHQEPGSDSSRLGPDRLADLGVLHRVGVDDPVDPRTRPRGPPSRARSAGSARDAARRSADARQAGSARKGRG